MTVSGARGHDSDEQNGNQVFDWTTDHSIEKMKKQDTDFQFHQLDLPLTGDIRLTFYDRDYKPFVR